MNKGKSKPPAIQPPMSQRTRNASAPMLSFFQRNIIPMPTATASGAISGMNTALKYGGPTEILPSPNASMMSGYSVPSNMLAAVTTSKTLFNRITDSFETNSKVALLLTAGARMAYRSSEPPTTMAKNISTNKPRVGSLAKAWTEVNTPERTRKVPSKLKEKAKIANKTVQVLNTPRFSVAASECIKAVPTNHGMNEAFSTGSQNHQPPQPSS